MKKVSEIRKTSGNDNERKIIFVRMLSYRDRTILFLDKNGFNLHMSLNHGYSNNDSSVVLY